MKLNYWLILGAMVSTSLLAQQVGNPPPAAPLTAPAPAETPAPAAAPAPAPAAPEATATAAASTNATHTATAKKKSTPKKKAAPKKKAPTPELITVPLVPGPATVEASNVNVRARAGLKGEVFGHVTQGQQVTVLEEITLKNSAADEPSAWAKILLPPDFHAWVNTTYIEATNKTVRVRKLNVRAGPGENYGILGRLEKGDAVKELNTKGDWMEIEAPTNAFAFVAAQYLKQEAPGAIAAVTPPPAPPTPAEPAPTPATVTDTPAVAAPPTNAPAILAAELAAATNAPGTNATAAVTPAPEPAPAVEEPPPKRIVDREGFVRGITSIQAPTHFALVSPETGKTINYLYTTSAALDLNRYKGMRIVVTGEEGLDERWLNTPVITIQKIQVLQ